MHKAVIKSLQSPTCLKIFALQKKKKLKRYKSLSNP
jgi:hypothetical protein